ncbi:MAG: DinB family protein [Dokdonella sp.]
MRDELALLARYNRWMNRRTYAAAAKLSSDEIKRDRGAFFGSVFGTLNHIMVADLLWLHRFARARPDDPELDPIRAMVEPTMLDQEMQSALDELTRQRERIDAAVQAWIATLDENALVASVSYKNTKGIAFERRLSFLLTHFFNHQTHHRGQATTLLSQAGIDVGVTDLALMLAEPETIW